MWGQLFSSEWKQESYTVHILSWCNWKAKNCPWSTKRWPCHFRVWRKNEEASRSLPKVVCSWRDWIEGCSCHYCAQFHTITQWRETTTKDYLLEFLQKAMAKMLQGFLVFTTGAPCLPNFGYGKIDVKFGSAPLIFASTCLQSLTLPKNFPDETTFSSSIKASMDTTGRSFNCLIFKKKTVLP